LLEFPAVADPVIGREFLRDRQGSPPWEVSAADDDDPQADLIANERSPFGLPTNKTKQKNKNEAIFPAI
jgi:hypothetical protein